MQAHQQSLFNNGASNNGNENHPAAVEARELLDRWKIQYCYITDPSHALEAVGHLLRRRTPLGLDTEIAPLPRFVDDQRAGLDPYRSRIRLIQVYGEGGKAYLFDLFTIDLQVLAPLWTQPLVAHNAVFDLKHLILAGAAPEKIGCTMLMANALTGRLQSLAGLAAVYLDTAMSKAAQTSDWGCRELTPGQLAYAALDAVMVLRLYQRLKPLLKHHTQGRCYTLMRDVQPAVARMELNGIHLDFAAHEKLMANWRQERRQARLRLQGLLGPRINPESGKQISDWLGRHLDPAMVKQWPRTRTGQLKTGASALAHHADHPLVTPLLKYKESAKLLATFGQNYVEHRNPVTDRIHANFRIGGTATGRMSCHSPNVQNPPRDVVFRSLFNAPPNCLLTVADYGQVELRVAALLSGDANMLAAYRKGQDLHVKTAAAVAGVPATAVTRKMRQAAKAVNFGLLYGQGPKGLAAYAKSTYGVTMTTAQAARAQAAFFSAYPGLRRWQKETVHRARQQCRIVTPGGRIRYFDASSGRQPYTEALNTPIQGGAAEVLMAALNHLNRRIEGYNAKLVNVVHDEILLEVDARDTPTVSKLLEKAMTLGFLDIFPGAHTTHLVDAASGPNWAHAK